MHQEIQHSEGNTGGKNRRHVLEACIAGQLIRNMPAGGEQPETAVSTKQKVSNNSATLSSDLHMHTMLFPTLSLSYKQFYRVKMQNNVYWLNGHYKFLCLQIYC